MQLRDLGTHPGTHPRIEIRERLVEQEYFRFADHRPAKRHALPLPAGQLRRLAAQQAGEAQHLRRLGDAQANLRLGHFAKLQTERHVLLDVKMREQRVILEHHCHVAILRLHAADLAIVEKNAAARGLLQPGDESQQGGLAATRRPYEHHQLAIGDLEAHPVHRANGAKEFAEIVESDACHRITFSAGRPFATAASPSSPARCRRPCFESRPATDR